MPRNMSFSLTTQQMHLGAKVVTRRLGWSNLKPGDVVCAVEKGMGLKKGEKVKRIGLIEVVSVSREPLSRVNKVECLREGFPDMAPAEFIDMFCQTNRCTPDTLVNRIAFKRLYEVPPPDMVGKVWVLSAEEPCQDCEQEIRSYNQRRRLHALAPGDKLW